MTTKTKKVLFKTMTLLLDVTSWFLGGMFVNDVTKFVTATAYTVDGFTTMGTSLFFVAVFFTIKLLVEDVLASLDTKKKTKKKKKKKKSKVFKLKVSKKGVKLFKAKHKLSFKKERL